MHRRNPSPTSPHAPLPDSRGQLNDRTPDALLHSEEEEQEDEEFKMPPWLAAVTFLGDAFDSRTMIGSIKNGKSGDGAAGRLEQVVGVVKSCVPNGLGDLFVILKDPTGTIGASIHRNSVRESSLGCDISVGCVLILNQVVVFCPGRSVFCLNITPKNITKVMTKDIDPSQKQVIPSSEARCSTSGPLDKLLKSGRQDEVSVVGQKVRKCNEETLIESRKTLLRGSSPNNTTSGDANASCTELCSGTNVSQKSIYSISNNEATMTTCTAAQIAPVTTNTGNKVCELDHGTDYCKTIDSNERKKMISRVAVTQWTDEQLLELFTEYDDDV